MFPARVHVGQIIAVAAIVVSTIWSASRSAAAALDHQVALVWLDSRFLASRLFGRISPVAAERTRQVEVVCGVLQEAVKGCDQNRGANRRRDIGRSWPCLSLRRAV
jgi:hypothetical protein